MRPPVVLSRAFVGFAAGKLRPTWTRRVVLDTLCVIQSFMNLPLMIRLPSASSPAPSTLDYVGTVERVRVKADGKTLTLTGGVELDVHRSCCVGVDDELRITKRSGKLKAEAICENGTATVLPAFRVTHALPDLGGRLVVREARDASDVDGYERLASYHYRAHQSFGRKAMLVATLEREGVETLVGYLELNNTFAGNKPRNDLLDAKFDDASGVSWARWDMKVRGRYLNAIARIGRCVVHPEFRGAGIGVLLCSGAIEYCKTHWHISRIKPLFIEITADMLKFVPFAQSAGMTYVGTTSGNIDRVKRDQRYLNRVFADIESGARDRESHSVFSANAKSMLQKQRGDVERIRKIAADQNLDVEQMLSVFLSADTPDGMSPTAYELLSSLLRFPKPTYMAGLTKDASAFLSKRLSELRPEEPALVTEEMQPPELVSAIKVADLSIAYEYSVASSAWANAIQEAFGIDRTIKSVTGVSALTFDAQPKDVVYVWGPSGSGKTGFLEAICGGRKPSSGTVRGLTPKDCAIFSLDFDDKPAIEQVGAPELAHCLFSMNAAGLSEAALYFKHPSMLSTGQRHRLAIARLIASRKPVWIVDEFCSVLDDTTAAIVSKNVGRTARSLGVTAFIAGPRREPVLSALRPSFILNLDSLGRWKIETPKFA